MTMRKIGERALEEIFGRIESSVVASQVAIHREWGGVVPELASGGAKAKGGVIDWGEQSELGELLLGKVRGRSSPEQITCFVNNIGMSLQFAACGAAVVERARQQGLGRELPGEWFTEDEHP